MPVDAPAAVKAKRPFVCGGGGVCKRQSETVYVLVFVCVCVCMCVCKRQTPPLQQQIMARRASNPVDAPGAAKGKRGRRGSLLGPCLTKQACTLNKLTQLERDL
jgi:hypothetical protein